MTHADRDAPDLKGDLDFSFSGLKTAVLRYVRRGSGAEPLFTEGEIADICASFQRVVVTVLIDRLFDAARRHRARSVGSGGVCLREQPPPRGAPGIWTLARDADLPAQHGALDRQRRDDRPRQACASFAQARAQRPI